MSIALGEPFRAPRPAYAKAMTPAHRVFLAEVLRNGFNLSAAYRVAYPDVSASAQIIASRANRLAKTRQMARALSRVREIADERLTLAIERYAIDRQRAVERLWSMAMTDIDQVADILPVRDEAGGIVGRQVVVRDLSDIEPRALASLVKVRQSRDGISVELADRRACIMDVARLMGWVTDEPLDSKRLVTLKIER